MKNILFIIFSIILLLSCNSNQEVTNLPTQEETDQINSFLEGEDFGQGYTYYSYEVEELYLEGTPYDYVRGQEISAILFSNITTPEIGVEKTLEKIDEISSVGDISTDLEARFEIQLLAYFAIDFFLTQDFENKDELSLMLIQKLFKFTDPIEWRPLFLAVEYSIDAISDENFDEIKSYMINNIERNIENGIVRNEEQNIRLKENGIAILERLKDL